MDKTIVMHKLESLADLVRDLFRLRLRKRSGNVLLQVSKLKELHSDKDRVF